MSIAWTNGLPLPPQAGGNVIIMEVSPEGRSSKNSAAQIFLPDIFLLIIAVLFHSRNLFPSGLEEEMTAADV